MVTELMPTCCLLVMCLLIVWGYTCNISNTSIPHNETTLNQSINNNVITWYQFPKHKINRLNNSYIDFEIYLSDNLVKQQPTYLELSIQNGAEMAPF